MTDETEQERPRRATGEGERRRRAAVGKLVAAVLVALPGAYAAVRTQYTADEETVKTEVTVRDRQEDAIRRHVESLRREIQAVREAAVTHKDLYELAMKLRDRERVYRPRSPARRTEATARDRELENRLAALRRREVEAARAKAEAKVVQRKLPALKSSATVRREVKRGKSAPAF